MVAVVVVVVVVMVVVVVVVVVVVTQGPQFQSVAHLKMRFEEPCLLGAIEPAEDTATTVVQHGNPQAGGKGVNVEGVGIIQEAEVAGDEGDLASGQGRSHGCGAASVNASHAPVGPRCRRVGAVEELSIPNWRRVAEVEVPF